MSACFFWFLPTSGDSRSIVSGSHASSHRTVPAGYGQPSRAWSLFCMPAALVGSRLHRESQDLGVPVIEPHESLGQIRCVAADVLPNAVIRRGLYYRYRLHWRND